MCTSGVQEATWQRRGGPCGDTIFRHPMHGDALNIAQHSGNQSASRLQRAPTRVILLDRQSSGCPRRLEASSLQADPAARHFISRPDHCPSPRHPALRSRRQPGAVHPLARRGAPCKPLFKSATAPNALDTLPSTYISRKYRSCASCRTAPSYSTFHA